MKIVPSIASAKQLNLQAELDRAEGIPYFHLDIEDGNFLPNITFGMKTAGEIVRYLEGKEVELDVHFLARNPMRYLRELKPFGISRAAAHIEALDYPMEFLTEARKQGMKAGLALNMKTEVEQAAVFAEGMDYVILMTSEPDGAGQLYNPHNLKRICKLRQLLPQRISIWADGGIGAHKLEELWKAGADTAVMGRGIWQSREMQPGEGLSEYHKKLEHWAGISEKGENKNGTISIWDL